MASRAPDEHLFSSRISRRTALRGTAALGASAGLASFLAACGDDGGSGGSTGGGGADTAGGGSVELKDTIVINLADESPTYNGLDQNIQYLRWVTDQVQECLYGYDDDMNIVPILAEALPDQPDPREATIRIKSGIRFHNGDPLTAEHVAATYNEAKQQGRIWAGPLAPLERAVAVDDLTVRFTFSSPYTALVDRAAIIPIMHKDYLRRATEVMGTGPYIWERYVKGTEIVLRGWDDYRDGPPRTPNVRFEIVPDSAAQIVNLLRGDCDILPMPPYSSVPRLKSEDSLTIYDQVANVNLYFWLSWRNIPDVRVRQAIAYAMDRQRVVDVAFNGLAEPGQGPIGPGANGWDFAEQLFTGEPDYERARSLLREAGLDRYRFVYISSNEAAQRAMAQVLKEGWAEVGIEAELRLSDFSAWLTNWSSGDWGISTLFSMDGFSSGRGGYAMTNPLRSDGPINFGRFNDRRMDVILNEVNSAPSPEDRARLWGEASTIAQQQAGMVPPAYPRFIAAATKKVQDLPVDQFQVTRLDLRPVTVQA